MSRLNEYLEATSKGPKIGQVYESNNGQHFFVNSAFTNKMATKAWNVIHIEGFIEALKNPGQLQREVFNRSWDQFDFKKMKLVNYKIPSELDEYSKTTPYLFKEKYLKNK